MKMDVIQTGFLRVHGREHILFLDFQDLFHSRLTSCYFYEVKIPAFMAFMFSRLPKASAGSDLCFERNCQTAESGGSLESLLIKTETFQTDVPQHPL